MSPQATRRKAKLAPHTALVYFHGMGDQKRFEEVSRIVDALDRYDHLTFGENKKMVGIHAKLEKPLTDLKREVGYISLIYKHEQDKKWSRREHRFYEAYWANITAGGVPVTAVLGWILKQAAIPLRALTAPWRDLARLKRSALLEAWPRLQKKRNDLTKSDLKNLLEAYDEFEGWEARRSFPKGGGNQFVKYIGETHKDQENAERLDWAARQWRAHYTRSHLLNFFIIVTFLLAIGLVLAGLVLAVASLLQLTTQALPGWFLTWIGEDTLKPTYGNVTMVLLMLFSAIGGSFFLREYLGDVYFWCSYEETTEKYQKRRDILKYCSEFLTHVLKNPACERVVVVAHSLGTTIAYDTILELARKNRARDPNDLAAGEEIPLHKIQHFITLASPIDKVHYFFENQRSKYHRYNRVVEEVRGDIGSEPFSKTGGPWAHWINFWDQADIISGSLQTPADRKNPSLRVDNHEVGSFAFPEPGGAHSAYFENRDVIETIYRCTFENEFNFSVIRNSRSKGDKETRYAQAFLGSGKGWAGTKPFQGVVMSLPWLGLAYAVLHLAKIEAGRLVALYALGVVFAVAALGAVVGLSRGHLRALK
ncbi:MAG: hypothetical protein ACOYZ8_16035 [Chloroflexota bacterium]